MIRQYNGILYNNKKEQTLDTWMNLRNIKLTKRSQTKKRANMVYFHLQEILEKRKLVYGYRKQDSYLGPGIEGHEENF